MTNVSRQMLHAYLEEALSEGEMSDLEQSLRDSEDLRRLLVQVMQERDRGDHSLGAIWRRERLSCPSRDQLGSFLLGVLEEGEQNYITFHLETIGCAYCQANLSDLESKNADPSPQTRTRRKRLFQSSAGFLDTRPDS